MQVSALYASTYLRLYFIPRRLESQRLQDSESISQTWEGHIHIVLEVHFLY